MSAREDDAKALAERMPGWVFLPGCDRGSVNRLRNADGSVIFPIPAPDAPLPGMLEFVGRIAEAIGARGFAINVSCGYHARVSFRRNDGRRHPDSGGESEDREGDDDLAHAAIRAALAAKGAT